MLDVEIWLPGQFSRHARPVAKSVPHPSEFASHRDQWQTATAPAHAPIDALLKSSYNAAWSCYESKTSGDMPCQGSSRAHNPRGNIAWSYRHRSKQGDKRVQCGGHLSGFATKRRADEYRRERRLSHHVCSLAFGSVLSNSSIARGYLRWCLGGLPRKAL